MGVICILVWSSQFRSNVKQEAETTAGSWKQFLCLMQTLIHFFVTILVARIHTLENLNLYSWYYLVEKI
jgi:hypothetical protein